MALSEQTDIFAYTVEDSPEHQKQLRESNSVLRQNLGEMYKTYQVDGSNIDYVKQQIKGIIDMTNDLLVQQPTTLS